VRSSTIILVVIFNLQKINEATKIQERKNVTVSQRFQVKVLANEKTPSSGWL
jgi:hypothetical protein